jgi:putative resolvase
VPYTHKAERLLTTSQAAALLGVHPQTLRAWTRSGKATCRSINERGDRRFTQTEIQRLRGKGVGTSRVALYVRVSGSTGQETSLVNQEAALRASTTGEVVSVYKDKGSGLSENAEGYDAC